MSAPVGVVLERAARLGRLKRAGVPDPLRFVRSEAATRAAIRRVAAQPAQVSPWPGGVCGWCGVTAPCAEHDDLDGLQPWR